MEAPFTMSGSGETHDHEWQPVFVPVCLILLVVLTVATIGGNWIMSVERAAGTDPALRASEGEHTYPMVTYPPTDLLWHQTGYNPNATLLPPPRHIVGAPTPQTAPAPESSASPAEGTSPAEASSPAASTSPEPPAVPAASSSPEAPPSASNSGDAGPSAAPSATSGSPAASTSP